MLSFADTPLLVKVAVVVVLAATLVCFFGVVALRFLRRGAARFWIAPASTAVVLLPAVLGAGLTAMLPDERNLAPAARLTAALGL